MYLFECFLCLIGPKTRFTEPAPSSKTTTTTKPKLTTAAPIKISTTCYNGDDLRRAVFLRRTDTNEF